MHTVYRLKASEIDQKFIDALKATFQDREIEIVVYEVDETAYLLASEANRSRLLRAVDQIKQRQQLVTVDLDQLA